MPCPCSPPAARPSGGTAGKTAVARKARLQVTATKASRHATTALRPYAFQRKPKVATFVAGPSRRPASTAPGVRPLAQSTPASGVAELAHTYIGTAMTLTTGKSHPDSARATSCSLVTKASTRAAKTRPATTNGPMCRTSSSKPFRKRRKNGDAAPISMSSSSPRSCSPSTDASTTAATPAAKTAPTRRRTANSNPKNCTESANVSTPSSGVASKNATTSAAPARLRTSASLIGNTEHAHSGSGAPTTAPLAASEIALPPRNQRAGIRLPMAWTIAPRTRPSRSIGAVSRVSSISDSRKPSAPEGRCSPTSISRTGSAKPRPAPDRSAQRAPLVAGRFSSCWCHNTWMRSPASSAGSQDSAPGNNSVPPWPTAAPTPVHTARNAPLSSAFRRAPCRANSRRTAASSGTECAAIARVTAHAPELTDQATPTSTPSTSWCRQRAANAISSPAVECSPGRPRTTRSASAGTTSPTANNPSAKAPVSAAAPGSNSVKTTARAAKSANVRAGPRRDGESKRGDVASKLPISTGITAARIATNKGLTPTAADSTRQLVHLQLGLSLLLCGVSGSQPRSSWSRSSRKASKAAWSSSAAASGEPPLVSRTRSAWEYKGSR